MGCGFKKLTQSRGHGARGAHIRSPPPLLNPKGHPCCPLVQTDTLSGEWEREGGKDAQMQGPSPPDPTNCPPHRDKSRGQGAHACLHAHLTPCRRAKAQKA